MAYEHIVLTSPVLELGMALASDLAQLQIPKDKMY